MTETSSPTNGTATTTLVTQPRNVYLISLLLTGVVTVLFYFSLTGIPLQGNDLDLFALPQYLGKSIDAPYMAEALPNAPLSRWMLLTVWNLSQGSSTAIRLLALFFHLIAVLYFFGLVRRWTGKQESVVVPLLGGLLYCVLPTIPFLLATGSGFPQLSSTAFALIAANSYLAVTENPDRPRFFHFCTTLLFSLLALGACYNLIVLPLYLLLLDGTRLEKHRETRLAPDWHILLAVTGVLLLLFAIIFISDSIVKPHFFVPWRVVGIAGILLLGRLILANPFPIVKNILLISCNVLLIVFAVFAFQNTMGFWEPVASLEKESDTNQAERAALQHIALAQKESIAAEQLELLRQAALLWNTSPPGLEGKGLYSLAYGRILEETEATEEARAVYDRLRETFPFEEAGIEAGARLAHLLSTDEDATAVADLLHALSKQRTLTGEEKLSQALAFMQLGDVEEAALQFSRIELPAQATAEKQLKEHIFKVREAIQALTLESQQKAEEDATSLEGFVSHAESLLLAGNHLQTLYLLDVVLQRDKQIPKAWELLGALFAMKGEEAGFIRHWGAMKAEEPRAWIELGHKAAIAQSWDAAYTYLRQAGEQAELTAEEMMAVFYLEQKRVEEAETWFLQAAEKMPNAFRPRLLLADLALAMQDKDKAQKWIDEAQKLEAPEAEINRRLAVVKGEIPDEAVPPALRRPTAPEQNITSPEMAPTPAPTRTLIE